MIGGQPGQMLVRLSQKQARTGHLWLTPVILAPWEAEIERIKV
jgi:hypothetical protein